MRALVQDYLKGHETTTRESASYGARVDDEIGGSTKTSEFWASAVSTMQEGKLPREELLRTVATIRGRTGWEDLVESLSVHAYIAKSQYEALMEEKRRGNFDDTREGNSSKRQTRRDKAREAASQELPIKDISASLGEKTKETKDKDKSIAYKLLSNIEAATDLKGVLEELILNAKVEFTLKEVLEIAKKEFHDVIIDSIKRKRQLMENGMEDSLELITSIGLGDNDKIVEIHSREVYTMLESFQAPEVTVETRYKRIDKKVKPIAGPLPEDSKEQMGEASKELSLRDPMSIGHQFTKETFEELKIGSNGSLLSEEITCFKKMLAKQVYRMNLGI
uniref:Predicted protein n=1 Tax=Physcomitrium patens TaxID=3218 RepID=A9U552_PHYPA